MGRAGLRKAAVALAASALCACGLVTGLSDYNVDNGASDLDGSLSESGATDTSSGNPVDSGSSSSGEIPDSSMPDTYVPPLVDASSETGWPAKRKLTVALGTQDVGTSSMAILILLDAGRIGYAITKSGGRDLRFIDPANPTVPLAYEVENWNTNGKSRVWVSIPTNNISPLKTTLDIWMFWGNAQAPDGQQATKVWDNNFLGVFHLVDAHDSTSKHSATNGATGFIGASLGALENGTATSFDTGQVIDTGINEQFNDWTLEAAFTTTTGSQAGTSARTIVGRDDSWQIQWDCTTAMFCRTANISVNNMPRSTGFGNPSTNTWHTVVATYNGNNLVTYLDGNLVDSNNVNGPFDAPQKNVWIGRAASANPGSFHGGIDEVRISNTVRNGGYAALDYKSRTDKIVTYGPEQTNASGTLTP